ncbi:MFS transporter [Lederbergia galactosidilytica]|uniref:MFS transporter n=1 Tax=Lederbergia galactosidilytica TaxID=217031 RepID=UPI000A59D01F|nr:MFS transporter [Lederbergia galactosidilytica]MBP1914424.1 MFS family permease [Lederbergia galactosidilytica]
MNHSLSRRQIQLWRIATYFIFALPGFAVATWVSRTPNIRDALGATTAEMGWIIFGLAVGSIFGLSSASHFIAHKGGRYVILTGLVISSIGLIVIGIGSFWITFSIVVFLGLAIFGFGNGICNVAMNLEGTAVEKAVGKSLLTGFHAAFSLGTLLGAMLGAAAIKFGIIVPIHLMFVMMLILVSVTYFYRLIPEGTGKEIGDDPVNPPMSTQERMAIWRERRTILIGIVVLGMAFCGRFGK